MDLRLISDQQPLRKSSQYQMKYVEDRLSLKFSDSLPMPGQKEKVCLRNPQSQLSCLQLQIQCNNSEPQVKIQPSLMAPSATRQNKTGFFNRRILFNSEPVKIKTLTGTWKSAVLNYDSFASDSSVHYSLDNCITNKEDEGTLSIQQYMESSI